MEKELQISTRAVEKSLSMLKKVDNLEKFDSDKGGIWRLLPKVDGFF